MAGDWGDWAGVLGGAAGVAAFILQLRSDSERRHERRIIFEGRLYPTDPDQGSASLHLTFRNRRETSVELHSLRILHPQGCVFGDELIDEDAHHEAEVLPGGSKISRFAWIQSGEDHVLTLDVYGAKSGYTFMVEAAFRDRETDKYLTRHLTLIAPPQPE